MANAKDRFDFLEESILELSDYCANAFLYWENLHNVSFLRCTLRLAKGILKLRDAVSEYFKEVALRMALQ